MNESLETVDRKLAKVLEGLGWSLDKTLKANNHIQKPPKANRPEDVEFPESIDESYPASVQVTDSSLSSLLQRPAKVPQSWKESILSLTPSERLTLHDFVISETGHFKEPEMKINFSFDESSKVLTFAEIMRLQKKQRKKRLKYRVAKVPPTTHTEELRSLIEMQMEAFSRHVQDSLPRHKKKRRSRSPRRQHKRRSRSRDRKRRRRSRSRSRNR